MSALGTVACIVGPTASGKSELADLVAEQLGSSVVSVDAMQVRRAPASMSCSPLATCPSCAAGPAST